MCEMGRQAAPSSFVNVISIWLLIITSDAVVNLRNWTSFALSKPLIYLCKNFVASRSPSVFGWATSFSRTFLFVGLSVPYRP